MIDINLVPPELRKRSTRESFFAVPIDLPARMWWAAGGLAALVVAVHMVLLVMLAVRGISLGGEKAAWQKLLPQKKNIDAVGGQIKDSSEKLRVIDSIASSKATGWAQRLNSISDALPGGMWLSKINVNAGTLTIEGSAVSKNQNEIPLVSTFVANLKKDSGFARDFAGIEVDSVQKSKRGATDVADFVVSAKFK